MRPLRQGGVFDEDRIWKCLIRGQDGYIAASVAQCADVGAMFGREGQWIGVTLIIGAQTIGYGFCGQAAERMSELVGFMCHGATVRKPRAASSAQN